MHLGLDSDAVLVQRGYRRRKTNRSTMAMGRGICGLGPQIERRPATVVDRRMDGSDPLVTECRVLHGVPRTEVAHNYLVYATTSHEVWLVPPYYMGEDLRYGGTFLLLSYNPLVV